MNEETYSHKTMSLSNSETNSPTHLDKKDIPYGSQTKKWNQHDQISQAENSQPYQAKLTMSKGLTMSTADLNKEPKLHNNIFFE